MAEKKTLWQTLKYGFISFSVVVVGYAIFLMLYERAKPESRFPENRYLGAYLENYGVTKDHDFESTLTELRINPMRDSIFEEQPVFTEEDSLQFLNCRFKEGFIPSFNPQNDVLFSTSFEHKNRSAFINCQFDKGFYIFNLIFKRDVLFLNDDIKNGTFDDCSFDERFTISESKISSSLYFNNSTFKDDASLFVLVFPEDVSFKDCTFNSNINFAYAIFSNRLTIHELHLNEHSQFNFEKSVLADTLDFSSFGKIYNDIDLTSADFDWPSRNDTINGSYDAHRIGLHKTDISKFHLDYKHFKLLTTEYNSEKKKWIDIPKDEMCGIYEGLLNNFKNRGQNDSYQLLDIEFKDYKWRCSKTPWMSKVEKKWWNYGYDKYLVFKWTLVFLLSFTLLTFLLLPYLNSAYTIGNLPKMSELGFEAMTIKSLCQRWWYSLVYTAAIFFGLTLKIENIEYRKFWGTTYIVIMYTLGIICLAYMANFVIQK